MIHLKDLINSEFNSNSPNASESLNQSTPSTECHYFEFGQESLLKAKIKKQESNRKNYLRMKTDPKWIAKRELKKQMKILASKVDSQPQIHLTPVSSIADKSMTESFDECLNGKPEPSSAAATQPVTLSNLTEDFEPLNAYFHRKIAHLEHQLNEERWIRKRVLNQNHFLHCKLADLEKSLIHAKSIQSRSKFN